MPAQRVTILDGTGESDSYLEPLLAVLTEQVRQTGAEIVSFTVRKRKVAHCIGCFGCWVETPGLCVEADDGREIAKAVARSHTAILFTPISFGGYASELKRMLDRLIPLALPWFVNVGGECHHLPRYKRPPRFVGIGIQRQPDAREAGIFRTLVGRNAINLHAPTYAAEVVLDRTQPDAVRQQFASALSRSDPLPFGDRIRSWYPEVDLSEAGWQAPTGRRALLIVGSPKTKSFSTSGVLGGYLMEQLRQRGWETESLTLRASLRQEQGQRELWSAVEGADLLVLAFPLYVDSLPFLVTKALEFIASRRQALETKKPQRIVAIVNNGFPEPHQNTLALAMCHCFAQQSQITWAGGLMLGTGEALSGGESLTERSRSSLPVNHVTVALDAAAAALASHQPLPMEAVRLVAKSPLPVLPFPLWRWVYMKMGNAYWYRRAAGFGVTRQDMRAQPFAG